MAEGKERVDDIEMWWEDFGDRANPTVLMVMGANAQVPQAPDRRWERIGGATALPVDRRPPRRCNAPAPRVQPHRPPSVWTATWRRAGRSWRLELTWPALQRDPARLDPRTSGAGAVHVSGGRRRRALSRH